MGRLSRVTKGYLSRFYDILALMIQGMTDAALTDSISHNFIVQMIPHHMAAIEMSRNLLQYTTFLPLQDIASNIIEEQTRSIDNMEKALESCSTLQNAGQELALYHQEFERITNTMFTRMQTAPDLNDINTDFLLEMIPHHQGAIQMSENALRFPICIELKPILQAIITSQRQGVREMNCLLYRRCH